MYFLENQSKHIKLHFQLHWTYFCRSGCKLVSTNVGGIPELLPAHYGYFVDPTVDALCDGLRDCIAECSYDGPVIHPRQRTKEINAILSIYDWKNVCLRTVCVYEKVRNVPRKSWWKLVQGMRKQGLGSFLLMIMEWVFLVFLNLILDLCSSTQKVVLLSKKRESG